VAQSLKISRIVAFFAGVPQILTYKLEIWQGEKHQNRHMSKFLTGVAAAGNIVKIKILTACYRQVHV